MASQTDDGLKSEVVQGGRLLLVRQVLGLAVSVGGVLALTRLIGPAAYGIYAAAFGIVFFAQTIGEFSLDVYLVRRQGNLTEHICHQAFSLLLVLGLLTTVGMAALTPLIAAVLDFEDFQLLSLVLIAAIPVMHLQQVPLSRLERALEYGAIGAVEVSAQLLFFAVALPVAAAGGGVWSPVAGWWTQQLVLMTGYWIRDDYRPRWTWDRTLVKEMLAFGSATTSSIFVYNLRNLVTPLFIGGTLGAAAVGYVTLATRLVEQLGFARQVVTRLSFAVLARLVSDPPRLRRALTQGTELQLLAVGIPLVSFALVAERVVPWVFGNEWRSVAALVPLLAPAFLAAAGCGLQNAVIMTRSRPWGLIASQGASAALLWAGALVFVPAYGLQGFAFAELLAIGSWVVTDRLLVRNFPRPRYVVPIQWWGAMSLAAIAPVTTWWLTIAVPVAFLQPRSVREARALLSSLLHRPGASIATEPSSVATQAS